MKQWPQETWKGITTRSPGDRLVTSGPTSSTMPIGSCPCTSPSSTKGVRTSSRWRSEPQIAVVVMRTTASVGSCMVGSGTLSIRTSRLPCHVSAFNSLHLRGCIGNSHHLCNYPVSQVSNAHYDGSDENGSEDAPPLHLSVHVDIVGPGRGTYFRPEWGGRGRPENRASKSARQRRRLICLASREGYCERGLYTAGSHGHRNRHKRRRRVRWRGHRHPVGCEALRCPT